MAQRYRRNPRYTAAIPIRVRNLSATTANLSVSGAQLAIPGMLFKILEHHFQAGPVEVTLNLGAAGTAVVQAITAYVSEYGDDCLIGVAFSGVGESDQAKIASCVETIALRKKPLEEY